MLTSKSPSTQSNDRWRYPFTESISHLRIFASWPVLVGICAAVLASSSAAAQGEMLNVSCPGAASMPTGVNLDLIRNATLCLVNRERAVDGERPLRPNTRLERAAQGHSVSMAVGDYFEHVGPQAQTPLICMRDSGYISSSRDGFEVGENIAWGTLELATPSAIVAAWMASPRHRANILDSLYQETGIGVSPDPPASLAEGQPGAIYTQDFGVIFSG